MSIMGINQENGSLAANYQTSAPPKDCTVPQSKLFNAIAFTGRYKTYTTADTWYPSWASDGNLYSPCTKPQPLRTAGDTPPMQAHAK